jgi:hypothetical protein
MPTGRPWVTGLLPAFVFLFCSAWLRLFLWSFLFSFVYFLIIYRAISVPPDTPGMMIVQLLYIADYALRIRSRALFAIPSVLRKVTLNCQLCGRFIVRFGNVLIRLIYWRKPLSR